MNNNIEIEVKPNYMAEQSNVMKDKYVFSYRITIRNHGEHIVTLRNGIGKLPMRTAGWKRCRVSVWWVSSRYFIPVMTTNTAAARI